MPSIFDDFEEFKKYIEKDEVNISYYGVSYNDLVKEFCNKCQIKLLRKLLNFKLEKHSSYNLPVRRLKCLNYMINIGASLFIKIINEKEGIEGVKNLKN